MRELQRPSLASKLADLTAKPNRGCDVTLRHGLTVQVDCKAISSHSPSDKEQGAMGLFSSDIKTLNDLFVRHRQLEAFTYSFRCFGAQRATRFQQLRPGRG